MNINKIRRDTAGVSRQLFMNSAGASLPPITVVQKITEYLREEEQLGAYKVETLEQDQLNEFYTEAAKLINCQPRNIAFSFSATEGYAKALSSILFVAGDYILTTNDDYVSNQLAFLSLQKRIGIQLIRSANLENGDIDLQDFEQLILRYKPKLVAVTHIPTSSGLVQDVEAVGQLCRKYDTLYLVDACQSVGQLVVDVEKIGCDFLSATGRKFLRGPRGTGFLYIADKALNSGLTPLFFDMRGATWTGTDGYKLGNDAKRFETFERPCAAITGLAEALRYLNHIGIDKIYEYNSKLCAQLREMLSKVTDVNVLDKGSRTSNIITLNKNGKTLEQMEFALIKHRVVYSVTNKSSALIDFNNKQIDWTIRLSPHYFNTVKELEAVTEVLAGI
jgi:selenocysteine lyase/cysteine desulfurase